MPSFMFGSILALTRFFNFIKRVAITLTPKRRSVCLSFPKSHGVWCLRMIALHAPSRLIVGQTIRLTCKFDLERDTLYSIKWYRDDVEFYRFVPRDKPPGQYFPMEGVRVDMLSSVNNSVILQDIDKNTSGKFKCEVSADAPSFQTEVVKAELIVKEFYDSSSCHPSQGLLILSSLLLAVFLS